MANDILFYAFNDNGTLYIKDYSSGSKVLKVTNGDFVAVSSLTETVESKKISAEFVEVLRLLKSRGFIIKFEC